MDKDAEVVAKMQRIGRSVHEQLPEGWGFIIGVFPFGEGGRMNYVSNARREDVVKAMKEFIEDTEFTWGQHADQ